MLQLDMTEQLNNKKEGMGREGCGEGRGPSLGRELLGACYELRSGSLWDPGWRRQVDPYSCCWAGRAFRCLVSVSIHPPGPLS